MTKTDENPLVAMLMELRRPEFEAKLAEAEKIANERLLQEYTQKLGSMEALARTLGVTQLAPTTPASPERVRGPYRTAKVRAIEGEIDWTKFPRRCTRCGVTKFVEPGFGTRPNPNGTRTPQSWCNECRSTVDYHKRPRTYKRRR